jgi:hypothetical protein
MRLSEIPCLSWVFSTILEKLREIIGIYLEKIIIFMEIDFGRSQFGVEKGK